MLDYKKILNKTENIVKLVLLRDKFDDNNQNIKIVFLNIFTEDLKTICHKIENNETLTKTDRDTANNIIPFFFKKIGSYDNYLVRFIFLNINNDINLNHFKNIVFHQLLENNIITQKDITTGCILYSYKFINNIISYNEFINYIMYNRDTITGKELVKFMIEKNLIPLTLKKQPIKQIIKELELNEEINYLPYELLSRPKLLSLFKSIPHIYGNFRPTTSKKETYSSGNIFKIDYYSFEGYSSDFFENYEINNEYIQSSTDTAKYLNTDTTDKNIFNEKDTALLDKPMMFNENTTNNTIYCYLVNDISKKTNISKFKENYNQFILKEVDLDYENLKQTVNNLLYFDDTEKERKVYMGKAVLDIQNTEFTKKTIYQLYDIQLQNKLTLTSLFQELISSPDIPNIYLVSDGEIKYYNVYRNVLRDISKKNIGIFMKKDDLALNFAEKILSTEPNTDVRKFRYLKNLEYIKLKRLISNREYINFYIFENGFILVEVNSGNINYNHNKIKKNIDMINTIIKKIKEYLRIKELPVTNIEKTLYFTSGEMEYSKLIDTNITFPFIINPRICYLYEKKTNPELNWDKYSNNKTKLSKTEDKLLELMNKELKTYINANSNYLLVNSIEKNTINFIYKNTPFFYSNNNIRRYMLVECIGKNLNDKLRKKVIANSQILFLISEEKAQQLFKEIEKDITLTTKIDITYVNCSINLEKKTISIKNINNKYQYINILKDINNYMKSIIFDLKKDKLEVIKGSNDIMDSVSLESDIYSLEDDEFIDDIELGALEDLIKLEEKEISSITKTTEGEISGIIKKGKAISINNYMIQMRSKFDSALYNPIINGQKTDYKYGRSKCPNTKMRQPFIVSKEELSQIDPESITGYMEYRGNYYICPRIWDATVNKPISVKKFIKAGLKSPYTGVKPILDSKSKKHITDEYGVIIRKPKTDTQWEEKGAYPDWPDILKKTEKDAYPGLTYSDDHPMKTCVPCCFINPPEDYDPKKDGLQEFKKPFGYQKCAVKSSSELITITDDSECKSEPYISSATSILKNCRLGLLPDNLDLLLNNNQRLFLNKNESGLNNGSGLFLRRGVVKNDKQNILNTMTNVIGLSNVKSLISLIENKLTPLDFIGLNNGNLINIFCDATYNFSKEKKRLVDFINKFPKLLKYLSIDVIEILDKVENIENYQTDKDIILLYNIYTGWRNYINYIRNDYETKNIDYLIEIFIKPRDWLIKDGCNIIIFNSEISSFKCLDLLNDKTANLVILIEEEDKYYIPVAYIEYNYNKLLPAQHLIKIDKSINIDTKNIKKDYVKSVNPDRVSSLVKLMYIQSNLCNYNLLKLNKKLFRFLKSKDLLLTKQYHGYSNVLGQIEFIMINNNLLLPIYRSKYLYKTGIYNYDELHNDLLDLDKYLSLINYIGDDIEKTIYSEIIDNFGYVINEFYVEQFQVNNKSIKYITGIKFENGLSVSVKLVELTANLIKKINKKVEFKENNSLFPNLTKSTILGINFADINKEKISIYREINTIINVIKNQLTLYISKNSNYYINYISKIRERKLKIADVAKLLNNILQKSDKLSINDFIKSLFSNDITKFICDKKQLICLHKQNKLLVPDEIFDYIIYKLYKDLNNNKLEALQIFKGKYIYSNKYNKNNVILTQNELIFILTNKLISKYIKNYKYANILETEKRTITEKEIKYLSGLILEDISKLSTISLQTTYIESIREIKARRKIHTTIFNSDGIYNPAASLGVCKFPYRSLNNSINYKCSDAKAIFTKEQMKSRKLKPQEQICPISVDKNKRVKDFGYCPEITEETMKRLNLNANVDTYKYDDKGQLLKSGSCNFPFIYYNKKIVNPLTGKKPFIEISFKCKEGKLNEGFWCYKSDNTLPIYIGAINRKYIYEGEWNMDKFLKDKQLDYKNFKYIYEKNGYEKELCTTKIDKYREQRIEEMLEIKDVKRIKLEEYNPAYCLLSESKKGYTKKQLYVFGKYTLGLNYESLVNKNNKIFNKSYLCNLFSEKIKSLKKTSNKLNKDNFYKLNPINCLNGPKKGGYKLNTLRELVETYLDIKDASKMSKEQLCEYILPNKTIEITEFEDLEIYPADKNINLCSKPVNRGGINKTKLNAIASKLNISIAGKKKKELCKLIKEKIEKLKDVESNTSISKKDDVDSLLLEDSEDITNNILF